MMRQHLEIHPSRLGVWRTCERRAAWEHTHPEPLADEHISAWIGSAVHAELAGQERPGLPERAVYDEVTPSPKVAEVQAGRIAGTIREALRPHGWKVLHRERDVKAALGEAVITGRADLYVDTGTGLALLDYKTGALPAWHVWLQLGAYAFAVQVMDGRGPDEVGLIACPRSALARTEPARVELREAAPAQADAMAAVERVTAVLDGDAEPLPNPGIHCRHCPVKACAVRYLR